MDCKPNKRPVFKPTVALALIIMTMPAFSASPWLDEPGSTNLSIFYLSESYNEFFKAHQNAILPADIEQNSLAFIVEHSLSDSITLDFKTGYTETSFAPASRGDFSGIDDSQIGIRWRFVDEYMSNGTPTLTLNAVAIIAGNYEESSPGNPHSPGDGASGIALSLLLGKTFDSGFSFSTEVGYRDRDNSVPSDIFFSVGAYYALTNKVMLSTIYVNENARSGVDIGDPGITPNDFELLDEDQEIVSLSLVYQLNDWHGIGFDVAQTIDGRNTGEKDIFVLRYQTSL